MSDVKIITSVVILYWPCVPTSWLIALLTTIAAYVCKHHPSRISLLCIQLSISQLDILCLIHQILPLIKILLNPCILPLCSQKSTIGCVIFFSLNTHTFLAVLCHFLILIWQNLNLEFAPVPLDVASEISTLNKYFHFKVRVINPQVGSWCSPAIMPQFQRTWTLLYPRRLFQVFSTQITSLYPSLLNVPVDWHSYQVQDILNSFFYINLLREGLE